MLKPLIPAERNTQANTLRSTMAEAIVLQGRDVTSAYKVAKAAGRDKVAQAIQKGGVDFLKPDASTSFNQPRYIENVAAFVGPSAFRETARKAVEVNFDDAASEVIAPNSLGVPSVIKFVAPGANIPVVSGTLTSTSIAPRKMTVIETATNELINSTNAIPLMRLTLEESIPPAVDAIMFGTGADDGVTPAGLRYGITAETSGGATSIESDLALLASKIAAIAGNANNVLFIADPATAFKIAIKLPFFPFQVVASGGLAAGTIIALACNALMIGAGSSVQFKTSETTALHMTDAPADIGIVGSPANVVSAPVRSMFQTRCTAIRIIFDLNYKLRVANSLAWMTDLEWLDAA